MVVRSSPPGLDTSVGTKWDNLTDPTFYKSNSSVTKTEVLTNLMVNNKFLIIEVIIKNFSIMLFLLFQYIFLIPAIHRLLNDMNK